MRAEEILQAAVEKKSQAERAAYLEAACGQDKELQALVEDLLKAHDDAGSFLEQPLFDSTPTRAEPASSQDPACNDGEELGFLAPCDKPGSLGKLAHYEVLEVIGRGGMGIVLRAFDEKLHRVVAIKVMTPALAATSPPRKRFLREARAAAAVRHEHVVDIHAVEDQPTPYLVMEYVSGETLQQKHERVGPLETPEVLRLGQQIALGLAAAHAQGLIHRDIKPSNILLEKGVEERVKITDFGLARAADDVSLTQSGVIAGTPMYMAPEQTLGETIDHRADLFSLGSVLYTMCSGRPPFRATNSMATLKRVAEDAPRPIREIIPEVPQWLCDIIARLHAKKPEDRFQSAKEVADLLGQHLAHLQHPRVAPIPPGVELRVAGAESSKPRSAPQAGASQAHWPHRRRLARAAAVLLCLVAGLSLTEATGVTNLRATVIRIFTPDGTLVVETDDPAVKVTVEGDGGLVITGTGLEEIRLRPGSYRVQADRDGKPVPLDKNLVEVARGGRAIVKVKLEAPATPTAKVEKGAIEEIRRFLGHSQAIVSLALCPGGTRVLSASDDGTVRVWNVETGKQLNVFEGHEPSAIFCVAVSPDGSQALSATAKEVLLWEVASCKVLRRWSADTVIRCVAFSPDGRRALFGGDDSKIRLWDTESWKELSRLEGHTGIIWSVNFSPDGRRALSACGHPDSTARLWDLETGKEVRRFKGQMGGVWKAVLSPNGRYVLTGSIDKTVRLWNAKTGDQLGRWQGHTDQVTTVAFSRDSRHALSGGLDATVRFWDVETGKELHVFTGHTDRIGDVAFLPDGRQIISGSGGRLEGDRLVAGSDFSLRLWKLPPTPPETKAFVLLGSKGVEERKFDTLAEAVIAASDGDTIEVRGNGPYAIRHPINIGGRALNLRAGASFHPVLRASLKPQESVFTTQARLIMEGLEISVQAEGGEWPVVCCVRCENAPLYMAHCTIRMDTGSRGSGAAVHLVDSPACVTRDCAFISSTCSAVASIGSRVSSNATWIMDNCVHVGLSTVAFGYQTSRESLSIQLTNNTVASGHATWLSIISPLKEPSAESKPVRLQLRANILEVTSALHVLEQTDELLSDKQARSLLLGILDWRDGQSLYGAGAAPLAWTVHFKTVAAHGPRTFKEWTQFWGRMQDDSLEGRIRYKGGELLSKAKTAIDTISPDDFRLRPDSAGYRAGKDKKDLGADVDLVGPGPAYERWKKTPEYQQWLKETKRIR